MNTSSRTRIRIILAALLTASALLIGNRSASADTTGDSASYAMTMTDYGVTLSLHKFNPSLGALTSVQVTLSGSVMSDIIGQKTTFNPQTVTGTGAATITLTRPDTTTLVDVLPTESQSATLQPFLNVYFIDFNTGNPNPAFNLGSSDYVDFGQQTGTQTASTGTLTGASDLALFTGTGPADTISLPLSAVGNSILTGGGSVLSEITTEAGATVTVTYTYTPNNVNTHGNLTTFTQGGWGTAPHGSNPGALLAANFNTVYPSGKVVIGGGFTITLTSAGAVQGFLPQGGGAAKLTKSYLNPTSKINVLCGQVLALELSVDFSNAAITHSFLASQHILSGPLHGYTVTQALALGNAVLGGNTSGLPAGVGISDLNDVITNINQNYDNGTSNLGYLGP